MTFPITTPQPPVPAVEYEPRIWSGRVWVKDGPFEGIGFAFKAPYGVYMNALQLLGRASATRQIVRFAIGPTSKRQFRSVDRGALVRYEEAFEKLSLQLGIDWSR